MKQFSLTVLALTTFLVGLIWAVGTGEAVQRPIAEPIFLADTVHINLNETDNDTEEINAQDSKETLFKEIKKFNQTAYDIKNRYMEDIDTKDLINAGIRGMLQDLDRYSVLMEKKSYDRLMESTHGKYEGLGIEIDARDNRIIVVTPFEGSPAYKKGLRSGDAIHKIDGTDTYDMTTSDAAKLMRGDAGTSVVLTIKREGMPELLEFEVERAVIEIKSVNYFGVIEGTDIGYVRLSRFAEETSHELQEALDSLNTLNVSSLIFDLRSNGGGLLQQAVETSQFFIEEGRLVVYTKGKYTETERRYHSRRTPLFPDKPLVTLVDEGTASASEIVAGALQDWDRAVIMGRQTYGKGLVQRIFPIGQDDDVALKLTTAKYYIPSGRCIQKPENQDKPGNGGVVSTHEETGEEIDSLKIIEKEIFYTNGGRAVYGGGGIWPDVELNEARYMEPIEINMERKSTFFNFAVKYVAQNPETKIDLNITDDILEQYREFLKEKDFTYKTAMEVSLNKMKELIEEDEKEELFADAVKNLEVRIEKEKEADFNNSLSYIKRAIKREIVAKLAGEHGVYEEVILKSDPDILEAIKLLGNMDEYSKTLESGHTVGQRPDNES